MITRPWAARSIGRNAWVTAISADDIHVQLSPESLNGKHFQRAGYRNPRVIDQPVQAAGVQTA